MSTFWVTWILHKVNIRHPGQLKKLKPLGPFWSYQLNSTANLAHLPRNRAKWAELAHVFPRLQVFVHILWFFKAKRLETKLITPYLHLKVIPRLSFWLRIEVFANLRIFYFSWVFWGNLLSWPPFWPQNLGTWFPDLNMNLSPFEVC